MKNLLSTAIFITIVAVLSAFQSSKNYEKMETSNGLTFTILYDNYKFNNELESDWGFSCLIEGLDKTILFDSGTKGHILLSNMKKMGKDPGDVDIVFLSHIHQDHTGGMNDFLDINPDVKVFMPVSFPDDFKKLIKSKGAEVTEVNGPIDIIDGVKSTGEMGSSIIEQSMVIKTEEGSIVITGCAHPGILDIVKKSAEICGSDILLVFGGFHLLRTSSDGINETVAEFKRMNVKYAGSTHCTGDKAINVFKENYRDHFIGLGVGKVLKLSELK